MTLAAGGAAGHDRCVRVLAHRFSWAFALAASLVAAASSAADAPRGCVVIKPSALFNGAGYLHYAAITSECTASARCSLWTDVDPAPQSVDLDPGQNSEMVFRRGSPAYEFQTFARCRFK